jgi:monoamine oxidase
MLALLKRFGLSQFAQHASGRLVFQDRAGTIRRDLDFATMGGALRVSGGLARITDILADRLGKSLILSCPVRKIAEDPAGVTIITDSNSLRAARVVLALPPRLAAGLGIALPDVPTWMAGQAKLVATYPAPFWRDQGLNGDAISHCGPLAEIHDASPSHGQAGALFGFAQPGAARQAGFQKDAIAQLACLFGPDAATPDQVFVKDWSADTATATLADQTPLTDHPFYQALPPTQRLFFAGTEAAPEDGGFLEGALAATEAALANILATDS